MHEKHPAQNPKLAEKEGIKGIMLPGRSIIARAESEMTRLPAFSDHIMLLHGIDSDPGWSSWHTRFLGEVYAGDTLEVKYVISDKKEDKGYGILAIDFEINSADDKKLS